MLDKLAATATIYRLGANLVVLLIATLAGTSATWLERQQRQEQQLSRLQTQATRSAAELSSQTLNGSIMGALKFLGLQDKEIKTEAQGNGGETQANTISKLRILGESTGSEGTFVVAHTGLIGSAWDRNGKVSTGFNVAYRPYFKTAMQGQENVYAAVSQVRGERMLYFAAPILQSTGEAIGAVVARTATTQIDELIRDKSDISLLISPQGVVFASNRTEWVGMLALPPTPERIRAIREIKQFGDMFNHALPQQLPFTTGIGTQSIAGKPHAVATAPVKWFDPLGNWSLLLLEDLDRTVPEAETTQTGIVTGTLFALLGSLLLRILASRHAQNQSNQQLRQYAEQQAANSEAKSRLGKVGVRLQQAKNLTELAGCFLDECYQLLGSPRSALYVADETTQSLELIGSFGCFTPPASRIAIGENLVGECARQGEMLRIATPADRGWQIRSGLGDCQPQMLLITPILFHGKLSGVLELALPHSIAHAEETTCDELLQMLAVGIEVLQRNQHIEAMVTELTQGHRAVADQLAFQQALIDTLPNPMFYKGVDTRFLGFNRAYEQAFGIDKADLLGKRVLDLTYLPESDRLAYQAEDEHIIATAGTARHELTMPFADGKLHHTIYSVSGFRLSDGSPGGLVGTFIDVGLADGPTQHPASKEDES